MTADAKGWVVWVWLFVMCLSKSPICANSIGSSLMTAGFSGFPRGRGIPKGGGATQPGQEQNMRGSTEQQSLWICSSVLYFELA